MNSLQILTPAVGLADLVANNNYKSCKLENNDKIKKYFNSISIEKYVIQSYHNLDDLENSIIYEKCINKFDDNFPEKELYNSKLNRIINYPQYLYLIQKHTMSGEIYIHLLLILDKNEIGSKHLIFAKKLGIANSILYAGVIKRNPNDDTQILYNNDSGSFQTIDQHQRQPIIHDYLTGIPMQRNFIFQNQKFDIEYYSIIDLSNYCNNSNKILFGKTLCDNNYNMVGDDDYHNSHNNFLQFDACDIIESGNSIYRSLNFFKYKYNIRRRFATTDLTAEVLELEHIAPNLPPNPLANNNYIMKQLCITNNDEIIITQILNLLGKYNFTPNFPLLVDTFKSEWHYKNSSPILNNDQNFKFINNKFDNIIMKKYKNYIRDVPAGTPNNNDTINLLNAENDVFTFSLFFSIYIAFKNFNFAHGDILLGRGNNILFDRIIYDNTINYVAYKLDHEFYYIFPIINSQLPVGIIYDFGLSNINIPNSYMLKIIKKFAMVQNINYFTNKIKVININTNAEQELDLQDNYDILTRYKMCQDIEGINDFLLTNGIANKQFILPAPQVRLENIVRRGNLLSEITLDHFTAYFNNNFRDNKYKKQGDIFYLEGRPQTRINSSNVFIYNNNNNHIYNTELLNITKLDNFQFEDRRYKIFNALQFCMDELNKYLRSRDLTRNIYFIHGGAINLKMLDRNKITNLINSIRQKNDIDLYRFINKVLCTDDIDFVTNNLDLLQRSILTFLRYEQTNPFFRQVKYIFLLYIKLNSLNYTELSIVPYFSEPFPLIKNGQLFLTLVRFGFSIIHNNKNLATILLGDISQPEPQHFDINGIQDGSKLEYILNIEIPFLLNNINDDYKKPGRIARLLIILLFILDKKINYLQNIINNSTFEDINIDILTLSINNIKNLYFKLDDDYRYYINSIFDIYNNKLLSNFLITKKNINFSLTKLKKTIIEDLNINRKNLILTNILSISLINYTFLRKIYATDLYNNTNPYYDVTLYQNVINFSNIYANYLDIHRPNTFWTTYKAELTRIDGINHNIVNNFTGMYYITLNSAIYFKIFKFSFAEENQIDLLLLENQQIFNIVNEMYQHNINFLNVFNNPHISGAKDYYLFRGENFMFFNDNVLVNLNIGDTYILPTHSSFSIYTENDFIRNKSIILRLKMNILSKCIFLFDYSAVRPEMEVLLSYGTILKVTNKQTYYSGNNIKYLIDLEYIGLLEFSNINHFFDYYIALNKNSNIDIDSIGIVPVHGIHQAPPGPNPYISPAPPGPNPYIPPGLNPVNLDNNQKKYYKYKKLYLKLKYGGDAVPVNNFKKIENLFQNHTQGKDLLPLDPINPISDLPNKSKTLDNKDLILSDQGKDSSKFDKTKMSASYLKFKYDVKNDNFIFTKFEDDSLSRANDKSVKLDTLLKNYTIEYNKESNKLDIFDKKQNRFAKIPIKEFSKKYITYRIESNFIFNDSETIENIKICIDPSAVALISNCITENNIFYISYRLNNTKIVQKYVDMINYLMQ
jgi:hypothetical protein